MDKYHKEILGAIKANAISSPKNAWVGEKYLGSPHYFYGVKSGFRHNYIRNFNKTNNNISASERNKLIDSLLCGKSFEERIFASELVWSNLSFNAPLNKIDKWLDHLEGWAEVDTLCQSKILIPHIKNDWDKTERFIRSLAKSENINKRRASLVLLVKPAANINDPKLLKLSLEIVEILQHEKSVLITKAISWILRSLIKYHKHDIKLYVDKKYETLPKIAIRETRKKLETGKK